MDLARAKDESGFSHFRTTPRQKLIKPSFSEALEFLSRCKAHCWNGGILDYDIELYNMELSCIGFALNEYESMCIPFVDSNGDYFTADQELSIMMRVNSIMGDKNFLKRGQNVIFDSHFLLRKYGIRTYSLHDTMVAQRILYPEFRIGLDFITSMWIPDIPYYKQDGKIWLNKAGEWETGWAYNCTDTLATAIAHPKQMAELEEQGNSRTYERQRLLIEPLTYMMERGIKVDLIGMEQESNESQEKLDKLQIELNTLAGKELNPNSPKQLKHYFYTELKHKPYLKDRVPTTNEDAMKRLARKGVKEANVILEMRKIRKRKGTYLVTDKVDSDGRLRCYYNPVGTRYSRISSSKSIFGTGTNLQNWPHDILRYLIADPGYVFYSLDLSQFENRVVAYVGKIANMIETFEKKLDMHRKTASLIFDKLYEEINDDERQDGKQSNHAFNYGYGPDSFSLKHEMPIDRARWIHQRYHEVYPELSSGYWRYVKDNLQSNRTLTNLFGRKTVFWGQWNDRLMNEAYSCIPQGTCGDLINERGLEYIYYNDHIFHDIELLTQVHDSIGFQIPMRVPMIDVAYMLRMIIDSLSEQLEFEGTKFDVPVDLTIGFNLNKGDGYELKSANIPEDVDTFADILSEVIDSKLVPF
jgi:DNA polymerase-1